MTTTAAPTVATDATDAARQILSIVHDLHLAEMHGPDFEARIGAAMDLEPLLDYLAAYRLRILG